MVAINVTCLVPIIYITKQKLGTTIWNQEMDASKQQQDDSLGHRRLPVSQAARGRVQRPDVQRPFRALADRTNLRLGSDRGPTKRGVVSKPSTSTRIPPAVQACLLTSATCAGDQLPADVPDIDVDTEADYDKTYAKDIIRYMRALEKYRKSPSETSVATLNPKVRTLLIDWLIQVQHYLKLHQQTLYLSTFLFDHCSIKATVPIEKLQLLLISCLLVACKMEERYMPELKTLAHLSEDFYEPKQILKMEEVVLKTMKFELAMPDPMVFLNRCVQASGLKDKQLEHLSIFVVDLCLPTTKMLSIGPSKVVAAAFCLALKILHKGSEARWTRTMEYYSGYSEITLLELMVFMTNAICSSPTCTEQGARTKYASKSRYGGLSDLPILSPPQIQAVVVPMLQSIERQQSGGCDAIGV